MLNEPQIEQLAKMLAETAAMHRASNLATLEVEFVETITAALVIAEEIEIESRQAALRVLHKAKAKK